MVSRILIGWVLLASGCSLPNRIFNDPMPDRGPVVFVADGAGDFRAASGTFRQVLGQSNRPIHVETVPWSHGYLRILKDQLGYAHGRAEGVRLAATIQALKKAHPEIKVYLVGHSAGSVVVLVAAESLPAGSIEDMALLAPSLSTFYDLRPALHAVRNHLDVFYSRRDWGYLALGTTVFGTSDRLRAPASGRIGFQTYQETPEDCAAFQKLRQHAWHFADWPATGNNGGHYGSYQPGYLRSCVVPLLFEHETGEFLVTIH